MRQREYMKTSKNSGIALVTVLLVAAVTIALAYGALSITTSALRGTKGAESSIQARLNAESGLDASFVYIEDLFRREENASAFDYIPSITPNHGPELAFNETYKFAQKPILVGDNITLIVNGHVSTSDTVYTTNADVFYNQGGAGELDPGVITTPTDLEQFLYRGITSCSGPSFSTGGFVRGDGNFIFGEPGKTHTIGSWNSGVTGNLFSPGSVKLSGGAIIKGNIYVNGDLILNGQPQVEGNIYVSGKLSLEDGSKIVGTVYSKGPVSVSGWGSSISGNVHTPATVNVSSPSEIYGDVFVRTPGAATGNKITGAIREFDKDILAINEPTFDIFNLSQINLNVCNEAPNIKDNISDLQRDTPNTSIIIKTNSENIRRWEITPSKIEAGKTDWTVVSRTYTVEPSTVQFLGNRLQLIRISSIDSVDEAEIHISGGHIALLVDGPINFKSLTGLTIESGSSLTIITPSKIDFSPGIGNSTWQTMSNGRRPSFTILSSHQSTGPNDFGIDMTGGSKILNALIYAPNTIVNLAANNEIVGAVLAKNISFSGGSRSVIHYDSDLLKLLEEQAHGGEQGLVIVKRR